MQTLLPPVLQALAWRLVSCQMVAAEDLLTDGRDALHAWVLRRLTAGPHGLPYQLATDAWQRAEELAPEPLAALPLIAENTLRLEQGIPRIVNEESWDAVCRIVDPELLALSHPEIASMPMSGSALAKYLRWSPVLRANHTVFHQVCNGEMAEVHAHMGGSMPNCLLWALLLHGILPVEVLTTTRGTDGARWADLILNARGLYAQLADLHPGDSGALRSHLFSFVEFDQPTPWTQWPLGGALIDQRRYLAILLPDRVLLHGQLQAARRCTKKSGQLLELVRLRNAFNCLLSQPPAHRGLIGFLGYYDRRSSLWCVPTRGRVRRRNLAHTQALGCELLLETWLDDLRDSSASTPLDIEWRTALPLQGNTTTRFIQALARGLRDVATRFRQRSVRLGLIHHTIKHDTRIDGQPALDEFNALWRLLQAVPALRTLIVGVDAAANELACPPRSFSKAYQWLRKQLDASTEQEMAGPPIGLGFTFHAGEDFRDLMTGIRHVDEAAHLLAMRPGDRLGHALALFWPATDFYIARTQAFATISDHALDLCWAAALMQKEDGPSELARDARERLQGLLAEVGASRGLPDLVISTLDLDRPHAWESPQSRALQHTPAAAGEPLRALREDELLAHLGISPAVGKCMAPRSPRPRSWQALADACQRSVCRRILAGGLIIEINPSSNRVIGGFVSPERLPYTRASRPGPRAPGELANIPLAIGTDDAGIFHTSLRREYELVGQSALAQGYALPDVHEWLDQIRLNACRASFIGSARARGKELLDVLDHLIGDRNQPH